MAENKYPECPYCGSHKVRKINTFYQCENCQRDFGRDASSDDGTPLVDAVREIRFRYGDTISGNVRLRIRQRDDGTVHFEVYDSNGGGIDKVKGTIPESEWKKLKEKLFGSYYIQDWDAVYLQRNDGKEISENNSWEFIYAVSEDEEHCIKGVDAYPPYWNKLMRLMDPYFKKLEMN